MQKERGNQQRHVTRNLDNVLRVAGERGFRTPIANIAGATALLSNIQDPVAATAMRLMQCA
jgi:hypothetical protein